MAVEREEWLARRFDVLDDIDVPDLWEQILGRADTEPNVDVLRPRRRRWVPLAVAAAAVLVLVGAGLVLWTRDESTEVDTPPDPAAGGANTVQIVEHDDADAIVTPAAVAGIVSFDVTNPTDGYRFVQISPMLPGVTIEEVREAALEYARNGTVDVSDILSDPALGVSFGPHDHFVTAMPLEAGEYAVLLGTGDSTFADAPDADGHEVRQLTITAGNAGAAPAPTMRFDRMAEDYLIGPILATPGTQTIRVDNTAGGSFQLAIKELRPDTTKHEYEVWEQGFRGVDPIDWSTAPIATFLVFYAGAAEQTVTVDLGGGDVQLDARPSFDEGGQFSAVWVTVE